MNVASEKTLQRLGLLVTNRRLELRMDKVDVARAADVTITTYAKVEAGQPVRDSTYGKIEAALGWAAGSCLDVIHGKDPIMTEPLGGGIQASRPNIADLEEEMRTVIQSAAVATTELTAPEIRKLTAQVLNDLKRRGILPHQ